jgi:hypothetical protein
MKIKSSLLMALILPLCLTSAPLQAQSVAGSSASIGGEGDVLIQDIIITKDGVTFTSSTPAQSQPACAKRRKWSFPLQSKKEKEMLIQMFAARSVGRVIHVRGQGKCANAADSETLSAIGDVADAPDAN